MFKILIHNLDVFVVGNIKGKWKSPECYRFISFPRMVFKCIGIAIEETIKEVKKWNGGSRK